MTDILSKLAALTAIAENGLLPCPSCNAAVQFRKALNVCDGNTDAIIHKEPTDCGLVEFSNGTTDQSILALWNNRPRETALIALVQEAAGEIERIREAAKNVINTFKIGDDIVKDGVPKYVASAIATTALHQLNQALNPQEAA